MAQILGNSEKKELSIEAHNDCKEKMSLQEIREWQQKVADAHQAVDDQQVLIKELEQTNQVRWSRIYDLERVINDLEWDKRELQDNNSRLANEVHTKDQEIFNLQSTNRELQHKVDNANYNSMYHE